MFNKGNTTASWAIRSFSGLARENPANFEVRYDWTNHTQGEVERIWSEVVQKIPATATKVLDLGCGGGGLAAQIKAARPDLAYHGVDASAANIATANALSLDGCVFEHGSVGEVLSDAAGGWDFVISVGCLFTYTDKRFAQKLATLLDASAPQGYILVADALRIPRNLPSLIEGSVGSTASYTGGDRDFLPETLLRGLTPLYVHRSATSSVRPVLPPNQCPFMTGKVERVLLEHEIQYRQNLSEDLPQTLTLPVTDPLTGRVIGTTTKTPAEVDSRKISLSRTQGRLPLLGE